MTQTIQVWAGGTFLAIAGQVPGWAKDDMQWMGPANEWLVFLGHLMTLIATIVTIAVLVLRYMRDARRDRRPDQPQ